MAAIAIALLILAMAGHSNAAWCVCKGGLSDTVLQKALDYACGAGADCNPLRPNGQCYQPNNVRAHCSYAVNSYYQKKGRSGATCDFSGTATLSTSDPSTPGCSYSASSSSTGTSTTPINNMPSTTTPSATTSPFGTTPTSTAGILGGAGNGLGPSGGAGVSPDYSHGGFRLVKTSLCTLSPTLVVFPALVHLMRGMWF